jgi:hypothetical protein
MSTVQRSFRIKEPILQEIDKIRKNRPANALANELLEEALKMRRCPPVLPEQAWRSGKSSTNIKF